MLDIEGVVRFHGHQCPGLAVGIRIAGVALREIGPHAEDEEVVAIVETDMCAVDAIQYLTGCTFGKGNLIHLDYGKTAFRFIRRSDGKAIRVVVRPEGWPQLTPEDQAVLDRANSGHATDADHRRCAEIRQSQILAILDCPELELLEIQEIQPAIPARARIMGSETCAACGERMMETRARRFGGQTLCIPCFEARERRM